MTLDRIKLVEPSPCTPHGSRLAPQRYPGSVSFDEGAGKAAGVQAPSRMEGPYFRVMFPPGPNLLSQFALPNR